jgi:hypothetical protein
MAPAILWASAQPIWPFASVVLLVCAIELLLCFWLRHKHYPHVCPREHKCHTAAQYALRETVLAEYYRDRKALNLPSIAPPHEPGGCVQSAFVQPVGALILGKWHPVSIPSVALTPWAYREWIPTAMLLLLMEYPDTPSFGIAYIRPGVYHITASTTHCCSHGDIATLGNVWFGMDPHFFDDSPLRTTILSLHLESYNKALNASRIQCPYKVPTRQLAFLEQSGIQPPEPGALAHAHPVHVALKRRNLWDVSRLLHDQKWFALWCRREQCDQMERDWHVPQPAGFFNPRYQAKDLSRYKSTPAPPTATPQSSAPVWFADDVLHHLSPSTVGSWFDQNPTLRTLVATSVIPPETAYGLPPQRTDLYTFDIQGNSLIYIPEGDVGGHYEQPADAHKWLTATKLVTPANECLHVALLVQQAAHQVVVISRPQFIPDRRRIADMPPLCVVPRYVMPWKSLAERITTPDLVESLVAYAMRVSITSHRDLWAKVAGYQAEMYGRLPTSRVSAAVQQAYFSRVSTWVATPRLLDFWGAYFQIFLHVPWLTGSFTWYTFSSYALGRASRVPRVWELPPTTLVSHPTDTALPGVVTSYCDAHNVDFFHVPPTSGLTGRFAAWNASLQTWLAVKMVLLVFNFVMRHILPLCPPLVDRVTWILGMNWKDTPIGVLVFVLSLWFRLQGPIVYIPPLPTYCWRVFRRMAAMWFFLPAAHLPFKAGLSLPYQVCTLVTVTTVFFPRLYGIDSYVYDFTATGHVVTWLNTHRHGVLIGIAFSLQLLVMLASMLTPQRSQLPHHFPDVEYDGFRDEEPPQDSDDLLTPSIIADPPCPPRMRVPDFMLQPPPPPPRAPQPPVELRELPRPAVVVPPEIAPPPLGVVVPPVVAHVNPDAFLGYRPRPLQFEDWRLWRALLARQPEPHIVPNPELMCVWDCLDSLFGLGPTRLLACWVANLPADRRQPWLTGGVPRASLPDVFNFFRCDITVRLALMPPGGCPRGGMLAERNAQYNPTDPPLLVNPGAEGWPASVFFLTAVGNDFHMTIAANPVPELRVLAPNAQAVVGYRSRSVPLVEVQEVLNVPLAALGHAYARLMGNLENAAARLCETFDGVAGYRAPLAELPAIPIQPFVLPYQLTLADAALARNLARDVKQFPHVMRLNEQNPGPIAQSLDVLAKRRYNDIAANRNRRPNVRLHFLTGSAGSGKTTALTHYLQQMAPAGGWNAANLKFHCWLKTRRNDLENTMSPLFPGLIASNFSSGMMPFVQPIGGTLVLDDATQCWPGFIPLVMAVLRGVTDIVITGDPTQGRTTFPEADATTRGDPSTSEWIAALSPVYSTIVRRYSHHVAHLFGLPWAPIPGGPELNGKVYITTGVPHDVPLLVVSPRYAETQANGGQRCMTFSDCQGQTIYGDVAVDLGGLTSTATDAAVWTALTRATGNIYLVLGASLTRGPTLVEGLPVRSQILSALILVAATSQQAELTAAADPDQLVARAVRNHLTRSLSPAACAALHLVAPTPIVGRYVSEPTRRDFLENPLPLQRAIGDSYTARTHRTVTQQGPDSGAPAFSQHKPAYAHTHREEVADILKHYVAVNAETALEAPSTGYTLPPDPILEGRFDPALNNLRFVDDAKREVLLSDTPNATTQHVHDGPHAYLHHTQADRVTNILSEQKRIRVGLASFNLNRRDRRRLRQLKLGFNKFFDVAAMKAHQFNAAEVEDASRQSIAPWVSKRTLRAMRASVDKDPVGGDYNFTRLFLKGQYIKKEEKAYSRATAGQIVSEFPLGKQFRDALWATYVERLILRYARPTTYLHCRASPDDMSRWYRKHWKAHHPMTACDFTAWDNGCDQVFVYFAAWVMEILKVPSEYVERYVWDRLRTRSYKGPHLPKQESGDRWTWLINTVCDAAITGAGLNCSIGTPAMFSGDDGNALGEWGRESGFDPAEWLMQPKREITYSTNFCGYGVGGHDIVLSPTVVMHRAQSGIALGRGDADYWRSIHDAIRECGARAPLNHPHLVAAEHYLTVARRLFSL